MGKKFQENYLKNLGNALAWAGFSAVIPKDKGTIIAPHPLFRLLAELTNTDAEELQFAYDLRTNHKAMVGSEHSAGRILAENLK